MGMLNANTPSLVQRGLNIAERLEQVLGLVLEALDTNVERIAVTDISSDPALQKDFPVQGAQRWILHRTPDGQSKAMKEALEDVLPGNVNRLGGTLVNSGAKPIRLYLATVATQNKGSAPIWLAAEGGSWDFRVGNLLWSGSICGQAIGGESTLEIVEV